MRLFDVDETSRCGQDIEPVVYLQGIPIHNGVLVIGEPGEYTDVRRKKQKGKGGGELLLAVVDALNPRLKPRNPDQDAQMHVHAHARPLLPPCRDHTTDRRACTDG